MESSSQTITFITEQSVICRNLMASTPRLTPTGKISHAKTRVYTQRYRKEWENMSDFKGWLTSVPFQPTRAYCLYCKKNLHAHRLSLLKHTCTMKHQRSALTYVLEEKQMQRLDTDAPEVGLMEEVETLDDAQKELNEYGEEDDIEYVVERLESDEDESMEFVDVKERMEERGIEQEDEKETDDSQFNEDSPSVIKKLKVSEQRCRDPLAEAMAHVHSEYLEEDVEDQENVQIEMEVESTNNDASVLSEPVDDDAEKTSKSHETEKTQEDNKNNMVMTTSIPILNTTHQSNTPTGTVPTQNTINFVPIVPNVMNQKTFTLMCGNKAFTLSGGAVKPGVQYVLTKLKGKPTALMLTDQKKVGTSEPEKIKENASSNNQSLTIPSTSQQSTVVNRQPACPKSKKAVVLGKQTAVKQTVSKKLCISTYVVDTIKGLPIGGLQVSLYKLMDGKWTFLNENTTNADGHCSDLVEKVSGSIGRYKIHFDVDKYFTLKRIDTMFPFVEIVFDVKNPNNHYHIPLLLSPFGYTTYRGT
ncbi:PREDICTED: uncharacterized protein LOC105560756 isoform X2 [Vollenhovia emeryi]|uniref:uncharacterized protein LOC105560756 isoform X2 n=1 Tax=Vollenhovia emeryi TaxID=411798 RepID=UPI0005F51E4C|nr:PREDICTED: uncharacterized protein LOC105560756 isoform X2 [Vollenhovia emeryi]